MYYEEKIEQIIVNFTQLFYRMLNDKNYSESPKPILFYDIINTVEKYYPEHSTLLNRVRYFYTEVEDSEEKLECLVLLYKNIKEAIYG